jgi:hypothetical protein
MRFLAAILVLIASVSPILAQNRQPAEISTQPTLTPQVYEILDKSGKWMGFGSAVNGVFRDNDKTLNPISFGAKCDGTTNDDVALHAWAAAITAGTHAVVPGVCVFTSPIVFPSVLNVSITGGGMPGTLLYKGTSTTGDLITIGITNGTCLTGWTINGLRVQSGTDMTAGTGVKFNMICEANIANFDVGGGIGGNENFWDAVWFHGGNSVRIRGFAFRGTNIAEVITGFNTSITSVDIIHAQGILSHSGTGLLLGGGAAGTSFEQTDILLNGENMRISEERLALGNYEVFLGPSVWIDVPDFNRAGATGVGIHINEPNANPQFSVLEMVGTWVSGSRQCILIEPESRWTINWIGGKSHICVPQAGEASIENRSFNARLILNGVRFYQPLAVGNSTNGNLATKGPYIEQLASSFYGNSAVILNDVRMEANPAGLIVGPWVGDYMPDSGKRVIQDDLIGNRVIAGAANKAVIIGLDWGNKAACGIWWRINAIIPGLMDASKGGCPYDIGSTDFPFGAIWAHTFSDPIGHTLIESQKGGVYVTAKNGNLIMKSITNNTSLLAAPTWNTVIGSGGLSTDCSLWINRTRMIPGYADGSSAPTPPCAYQLGTTGQPFQSTFSNEYTGTKYTGDTFLGHSFKALDTNTLNVTGGGGQVVISAPGNQVSLTAGDNVSIHAKDTRSVVIGTGISPGNCSLWLQNSLGVPGKSDGSSAGCSGPFYWGTTQFPFNNVFAKTAVGTTPNGFAVSDGTTAYYGETDLDGVFPNNPGCKMIFRGGLLISHANC